MGFKGYFPPNQPKYHSAHENSSVRRHIKMYVLWSFVLMKEGGGAPRWLWGRERERYIYIPLNSGRVHWVLVVVAEKLESVTRHQTLPTKKQTLACCLQIRSSVAITIDGNVSTNIWAKRFFGSAYNSSSCPVPRLFSPSETSFVLLSFRASKRENQWHVFLNRLLFMDDAFSSCCKSNKSLSTWMFTFSRKGTRIGFLHPGLQALPVGLVGVHARVCRS